MSGKVLVVEDEPMVQILLEDICAHADVEIVAMVDTVKDALAAIDRGGFKAVILDVNLHGETSEPIAAALQGKGYPVLVSTGSFPGELPAVFKDFTIVQKPFSTVDMVLLLSQVAF